MTTITALFAGSLARADGWGFTPRATLVTGYDQNVQLAIDGDEGQGGGAASVGAQIARHSDTTDWSLDPQLLLVRYPKNQKLNRDDINVTGAVSANFERAQWSNTVAYHYDTTLTSERGVSGLTESNLPHEHIGLTTMPSIRFAQRWTAAATASWSADTYDEGQAIGLVDYNYASVGGQLSYALTERTSLGFDASVGRFTIPDYHNSTDQYAANVRFDTALNELWNLSIGGGPLRVVSGDLSDPGLGLSVKLQRRSATSSFAADLTNDTTPDGRGTLSRQTRAALSFSRNLTSRFATDLSAQWMWTRDALPEYGVEFGAITYWNVSPALRWQATPTLNLAFSLTWGRQETEHVMGHADAFRAALSLTWQGLERGQ